MDFREINFIVQNFFINSKVLNIDVINSGLINKSYIIEYFHHGKKSKFILQRLSKIFESYDQLNINHNIITEHINQKTNCKETISERWEVPILIRCKTNKLFVFPFQSYFWRAMVYIDKTVSFDFLEDQIMAYQVGVGLAKFHLLCSDLDGLKLKNTIKNFHDTDFYIDQYIKTLRNYDLKMIDNQLNNRIKCLIYDLSKHIEYIKFLLKSLNKIKIEKNIIHGDPKLSNFLFDIKHKYVVSLVDLDTVSSGYYLIDLADCIRSICNLAGEDPKNKENVCFDMMSFKMFLNGYLSIDKQQQNSYFKYLPEFIYLIIFELTIRYFTDFLKSNIYFKINYETHNLYRAEVQYRLLFSFLRKIPHFLKELNEIGICSNSTFIQDVQRFV